jgi:hypothetical protein
MPMHPLQRFRLHAQKARRLPQIASVLHEPRRSRVAQRMRHHIRDAIARFYSLTL